MSEQPHFGSVKDHWCYVSPKPDLRRGSRYCLAEGICPNSDTHRGMANGVCLTSGCEFHMHLWAKKQNKRYGE